MSDLIPEQWLPEDLTGTKGSNYIKNESHRVSECITSSSAGKTAIISPYRGAFYNTDDLTITYKKGSTETLLSRTDFRVIGMDVGRTRASTSIYGVYRFIQLTYDTAGIADDGVFVISYHAFGGEIDRYAYSELVEMIRSITGTGSGSDSAIDVVARGKIADLEDTVGALSARLNYSAVTSPTVTRSTDGGWSPIAFSSEKMDAYIDFTKPATLTGTGSFVLVSEKLHGIYNFTYEIIKTGATYKCNLTCDVQNQKITPFETVNESYFTSGMVVPMFKMEVDTAATPSTHRLVLKMALVSNGTASYDIHIGDKTDIVLVNNASYSVSSSDDPPDSQTFDAWEVGTCTSASNVIESNVVLGLQDYYKIWAGNASLRIIEDISWEGVSISKQWNKQNVLLPTRTADGYLVWPFIKGRFDTQAIKSMRIDVYDRYEDKLITATGITTLGKPYSNASSQTVYACINYFPFDNCLLELCYFFHGGRSMIKLFASSGNSSYLNKRFDLRAIYFK